jgi:hypothetical protein
LAFDFVSNCCFGYFKFSGIESHCFHFCEKIRIKEPENQFFMTSIMNLKNRNDITPGGLFLVDDYHPGIGNYKSPK